MAGAIDTPMMRQYLSIKAQVPDALLLYRMGDFYELFFEDAREAAEILELTLTSRNRNDPDPIPMAGIPYHALDGYLRRLVGAGRKVALAEQRTPMAGQKLLDRELVRVVTPGIPWDSETIVAREPCYLAAIWGQGPVGLAFLDASTGRMCLTELPDLTEACAEVLRMEPRELIIDPSHARSEEILSLSHLPRTLSEQDSSTPRAGRESLRQLLGRQDLMGAGLGNLGPALSAVHAVIAYAKGTARISLEHVKTVQAYEAGAWVVLDEATRRNLEVFRLTRGTGRRGTLIHLVDRCCTAMGGRLLRDWLHRPLIDLVEIQRRQNAVETFLEDDLRAHLRVRLQGVADLERLAAKIAQGCANARDLVALASSLAVLPAIMQRLRDAPSLETWLPTDLCKDLPTEIQAWLVDEPPLSLSEGGMIREGMHADLDEVLALSRNGRQAILEMEQREREATGIGSLKIRFNRVFGYFLEVTQANRERVPEDWTRKQTLANSERFITAELKEFEDKLLGADERRKSLETQLFRELRARIALSIDRIQEVATCLARLDVLAGMAELAVDRRYCRPEVDESLGLEIDGGRHPVVESMDLGEDFVPNDLDMDEESRLIILTGPNMAGKSTVMRQVALIVLLAQIGSFVPANRARIGLVDRILVRVGASDDLAHGRSTFMVEMSETAHILRSATRRSFILLDEIGRGTSTYDGLAIAWAIAEAIHDRVFARTIFATHYHELSQLAEDRSGMRNLHVAVSEWKDQIVFLRILRAGGASRSHGIQCARLAGIPDSVIDRAKTLLSQLEARGGPLLTTPQLPLFGTARDRDLPKGHEELVQALEALNPDDLSPRQAHSALYSLRALLEQE